MTDLDSTTHRIFLSLITGIELGNFNFSNFTRAQLYIMFEIAISEGRTQFLTQLLDRWSVPSEELTLKERIAMFQLLQG